MKIDELIKHAEIVKKAWSKDGATGNLDVYIEVNEDINCPTCGEPETHIYDGFPEHTTVKSINSIATFVISARRDSDRS